MALVPLQGLTWIFFAREGKWDAQTMHLLFFAISTRNVAITKKCLVQSRVGWGGGGGGGGTSAGVAPLYQSLCPTTSCTGKNKQSVQYTQTSTLDW